MGSMASTAAAPVVDKTDGLDLLGVQADAAVLKMLVKQNPRGTKCVSSRGCAETIWNPHRRINTTKLWMGFFRA